MKVVICIATMEAGGAERQVSYLARGFAGSGHEVHVVLLRGGPNLGRLLESGATIHLVGSDKLYLKTTAELVKLFRKLRPHVAYLWQRPFDVCGSLAAFLTKTPFVHAERTDPRHIAWGPKTAARVFWVKRSRGVIANSQAGASYWLARAMIQDRVICIPNALPLDEFHRIAPSPESAGHIVAVGRLDENKNVLTVLKAIRELKARGILVKLLVIGIGPYSDLLTQFVSEAGLERQVRLLGFRNDVWALMKGSKGLVSLSYCEGEPNVVLEARALGCRLLLSDIPAHRAVANATDTVMVSATNVGDVAESLQSLFKQDNLWPDSGDETQFTLQSRSIQVVTHHYVAAFRQFGLQVD